MSSLDDKKREKELIKAFETPEQKRLRRLAKKEAKEKKRKALMGWDAEYLGYTNSDNPFGDANLHQTFLWKKKYEKLGIKDVDPAEIERQNRIKLEENKRELEKVKQRRLEREREKEERLKEIEREQREKEAKQFLEYAQQEDNFHLKQAKLRSKLRMKEGRAKPIDILARYIDAFGEKEKKSQEEGNEEENKKEELPFDLVEPYLCLNGLRISDLEDLYEDIKVYKEIDFKSNLDYWNDLQVIVDDELNKLRAYQSSQKTHKERSDGINTAVSEEVNNIFKGKTPAQLEALQVSIEKKINSRQEGIDISYWETLLSKLKAFMARARLKELHQKNLKRRLERLKHEQGVKSENQESTSKPFIPVPSTSSATVASASEGDECSQDSNLDDVKEEELNPIEVCIKDYESGRFSPTLLAANQVEVGTILVDPVEDWKKLQYQRQKVLNSSSDEGRKTALMTADEIAFEREARRGMGSDESVMRLEESIVQDKNVISWSDKYRPRKPRYFNRVHTGFEWNKYNQTHYDVDNPPPKIVQGYKFNIFYPDLIDKNQAPTYTVTPCPDNRDFAIIRFKAGPPYEDIAFKIVNREWNYSYKSGFRCQFQNNILQLWFHFKRYRYRR